MSSLQVKLKYQIDVSDEGMSTAVAVFIFSMLIFTCLLGVSMAIYALYRIFGSNKNELKSVDSCTVNSAISCIILHALTLLLDPLAYYFFMTDNELQANTIWIIWDILWTASKLNLYFVYIYRCYITFKGTKYGYSPIKVYVPLCFAWAIQLFNMSIFLFHDLDESNRLPDQNNPLNNDDLVVYAAILYLILDFIIVLAVLFLFLRPIVKLMSDLRTKSEQIMTINSYPSDQDNDNILKDGNKTLAIELIHNQTDEQSENDSESSQPTMTEPHSPTKMGAAYMKKPHKNKTPITPRTIINNNSNSLAITARNSSTVTTSIDTQLCEMKQFGRLPCPEDEEKKHELENLKAINECTNGCVNGYQKSSKFDGIIWNEKQIKILNTGTRLALLSVISLSSAFFYQFLWILSVREGKLGDWSYTWGVDTVINITCIYLSFQFAAKEYNRLCEKCCCCFTCCCQQEFNCHKCCFKCVGYMAKRYHVTHQ